MKFSSVLIAAIVLVCVSASTLPAQDVGVAISNLPSVERFWTKDWKVNKSRSRSRQKRQAKKIRQAKKEKKMFARALKKALKKLKAGKMPRDFPKPDITFVATMPEASEQPAPPTYKKAHEIAVLKHLVFKTKKQLKYFRRKLRKTSKAIARRQRKIKQLRRKIKKAKRKGKYRLVRKLRWRRKMLIRQVKWMRKTRAFHFKKVSFLKRKLKYLKYASKKLF